MLMGVFKLCIFFKQKTAYGMRISDWSSDVCSSDLLHRAAMAFGAQRCVDPHRARQAAAVLRHATDVLLGACALTRRLARGHEPPPVVYSAGPAGRLRRRPVGRARADGDTETRRGPRPGDPGLQAVAGLGHPRLP